MIMPPITVNAIGVRSSAPSPRPRAIGNRPKTVVAVEMDLELGASALGRGIDVGEAVDGPRDLGQLDQLPVGDLETGAGRELDVGEELALDELGNELGAKTAEEAEAADEQDDGHRHHNQGPRQHAVDGSRVVLSHRLERSVEQVEEWSENGAPPHDRVIES